MACERCLKLLTSRRNQRREGSWEETTASSARLNALRALVPSRLKAAATRRLSGSRAQKLPPRQAELHTGDEKVSVMGMSNLIDSLLLGPQQRGCRHLNSIEESAWKNASTMEGSNGIPGMCWQTGTRYFWRRKLTTGNEFPLCTAPPVCVTLATVDHPVEQSSSRTWHASRFVVVIFGVMV